MKCTLTVLTLAALTLATERAFTAPLGTAFTYQGRLMQGTNPFTGLMDFEFKLFDDPATGNQIGATSSQNEVRVTSGSGWTEIPPPYATNATSLYFVEPVPTRISSTACTNPETEPPTTNIQHSV